MFPTFEATVDDEGHIKLKQDIRLETGQRLLVTVVGDAADRLDTLYISEQALLKDWGRTEEDEAWGYLQPGTLY